MSALYQNSGVTSGVSTSKWYEFRCGQKNGIPARASRLAASMAYRMLLSISATVSGDGS